MKHIVIFLTSLLKSSPSGTLNMSRSLRRNIMHFLPTHTNVSVRRSCFSTLLLRWKDLVLATNPPIRWLTHAENFYIYFFCVTPALGSLALFSACLPRWTPHADTDNYTTGSGTQASCLNDPERIIFTQQLL